MRREAKASSAGSTSGRDSSSARSSRFALTLALALLSLLALAPSAGAVLTRALSQTVGADGNSPGTAFGVPLSLAFNQTTKRLYALNQSPATLYGFDASTPGTYTPLSSPFPVPLTTAPSASIGNAQINVDQQTAGTTAGRIYYATGQTSGSAGVLYAYDSGGNALASPFPINPPTPKQVDGVAADSSGTIFLSNGSTSARKIFKYDPISGALVAQIDTSTTATGRPFHLAMDSNDDLYVVFGPTITAGAGVYRFTAASGYSQAAATVVEPDGGSAALRPISIALDTSTHVLYVAHQSFVTAYDAPTATPLYSFGTIAGASYSGIAVDQSTNKVYLADNGNKRIQVFAPPAPAPNATGAPQAATNLTATTVTLNATIDDNSGLPTKWRFQTSKDGATWTNAGTGGTTAGGGSAVPVSANVTGLTHNTDYHFRIVTNKGNNPAEDVPSSDLTFHTLTILNASASVQAATGITGTGATLNATVSNNGPRPTAWRFEISPNGTSWSTVSSGATASATAVPTGTGTGTLTVKAAGGTYTLSYLGKTTGPIAYNAPATDPGTPGVIDSVQEALAALSNVGAGNILVGGGPGDVTGSTPYTITFTGSLSAASVVDITSDPIGLSGSASPIPLSATASGLLPNSTYKFRLVTSKGAGSDGDIPTGALSFKTLATAPLVSGLTAINVADTSALLVGQVDPRGSETGYVFEYGTTPALGNSTEPVGIGNAQGFQLFTLPLNGLKAHTTYYYRLVATNVAGSTASAFKTLTTRVDPFPLPDDRAYEMVSPPDKNGGGAQSGTFAGTTPAYDGGAIGFCTSSLFGDPAPEMTSYGYACGDYVSHRGALGWTTRAVAPPVCGAGQLSLSRLSLNLEAATFIQPERASCALSPLTPAAPMPSTNLYRRDLLAGSPTYELLNPVAAGGSGPFYSGSSDDFSHIVYTDTSQQTGDAPAGNFAKIYDWNNGTLSLISKSTAGAPFTTASSVAGGGNANQGPADPDHGVSASGDRIFFQNPSTSSSGCIATNCELYLRQDGSATYWASQQECSPACSDTSSPDVLRYATPDGSKAFFTTAAKLTNEDVNPSGDDLYMFTQSADPATDPHNLTLLSQDNEPADGTSASVLGVVGASDDGNTVYFAASGQLVLGQPTAAGPKLYRWHYDAQTATATLDYLATLGNGDAANWQSGIGSTRNVTPDGQYLLVRTAGALDPVADSDNTKDFYRWDQKGAWTCISCQGPGVASSGDAIGASASENNLTQINARRRILMSDDGQRIFFTTADALLPADTNATGGCPNLYAATPILAPVLACLDTYEWHDGTVSLISTGTSSNPSYLLGVSHDGTDAFFYTTDQLVGWDGDTAGDIYDARIGGGFPEPPPTGAPCDMNAGACEGAPSVAPQASTAGTAQFTGPGNTSTNRKPKSHKKKKKHHKRSAKQRQHRAAKHNRRAAR